jgi:pimeloyl-ACP methyl ester carboxylesterase
VRASRARLDWREVIAWALYPVFYLVATMARGALTGEYPYPFLDIRVLGVAAVSAYVFAMASGFFLLCSGLLMIARARVRPAFFVALLAAGALVTPAPAAAQTKPTKHVVQSDGHPLTVWSKRPARATRAILLVHGRTWSTLPDFDLQVPGEHRSLMDALVAKGYAVYGVDLRGYGATPRDKSEWDTPVRSADDIANVLKFIQQDAGLATKPALFGWSNGSAVGALAALRRPELMSDLILFGYFLDPDVTIPAEADTVTPAKTKTTATGAAEDFIAKGVISQKAIDAYVKAALAADPGARIGGVVRNSTRSSRPI